MRLLAALFLSLFATSAAATPPRYISVEEVILAENATHLFLIRSVKDNLGYHHTTQTDTFLISRDLRTGEDERIWPVMRVLDYGDFYADYGQEARVENLGAPDRVNPFDVLLWRGAAHVLPAPRMADDLGLEAGMLDLAIVVGPPGSVAMGAAEPVSHRVHFRDLIPQIEGSLAAMRQVMPIYENGSEGEDLLLTTPVDYPRLCEVGAVHQYLLSVEPYLLGAAARIDCFDEDAHGGLSYWAIVPTVE